jgi:hypothetical protein
MAAARSSSPFPPTHILCEQCGYDIHKRVQELSNAALQTEACPECGRPLAASDPAHKPGTKLELRGDLSSQGMNVREQIAWCVAFFRSAKQQYIAMRCTKPSRVRDMMITRASIANSAAAALWVIGLTLNPQSQRASTQMAVAHFGLIMLAIIVGVVLALFLLTWLESRGMVIVSKLRGHRLTQTNSNAIAAHACTGWLTGAYIGLVLVALTAAASFIASTTMPNHSVAGAVANVHGFAWPAITALCSFGLFEYYCWVGMRVRKFSAD